MMYTRGNDESEKGRREKASLLSLIRSDDGDRITIASAEHSCISNNKVFISVKLTLLCSDVDCILTHCCNLFTPMLTVKRMGHFTTNHKLVAT